jgi:hypothetical protein
MDKAAHAVFVMNSSEEEAFIPGIAVTPGMLHQAVVSGEHARARCTEHHPKSARGFSTWSEIVRTLRDLLVPRDWTIDNTDNYPTVVSPDGRTAIAVSSGDRGTGNPSLTPTTKHSKGRATRDAVKSNQLDLFPVTVSAIGAAQPGALKTWILLVNRRRSGDKKFVMSEISLPGSITDEGWIATWDARYILPEIELDSDPSPAYPDDADEGQDYDVPVSIR